MQAFVPVVIWTLTQIHVIFVSIQLKSVEFLLGSTAKIGELIVLGMLTQIKEVSILNKFLMINIANTRKKKEISILYIDPIYL